jgi:CheY-like chemotaxis protein
MGDVMQLMRAVRTLPTVLVVDDEISVRSVERRVLEAGGYQILEAADGAEGLDRMAGDARVDLLIADLDMPVIGGDEMARRIRMVRPDLPVLYVTGHIDQVMDVRRLWEGEAFLEKPFTAAGLREAVSLLLDGTLVNRRRRKLMPPATALSRVKTALTGSLMWR